MVKRRMKCAGHMVGKKDERLPKISEAKIFKLVGQGGFVKEGSKRTRR